MASLVPNVYYLSYYGPKCTNYINLVPHILNVYLNGLYSKKISLNVIEFHKILWIYT